MWDQATDDSTLKEVAAILRQAFLVRRAKRPNPTDDIWQEETDSSSCPEQLLAVEDEHQEIANHLLFMSQQPAWLCTDECDHMLDIVRKADPDTYYPCPAKWWQEIGTFSSWHGTQLSLATFRRIIWFVIVEQHWVHIEIVQDEPGRRVFVHGLPSQRCYCEAFAVAIADMCHLNRDQIELHYWESTPPEGLCGWSLLFDAFAHRHQHAPHPMQDAYEVFQVSRHWELIQKVRAQAPVEWRKAGANPELLGFCSTIRDHFLTRILEGRVAKNFGHAGAPPDGKDADMKEAKAQKAVQDPLFINDPWARKMPRTQSTKWEDLQIPKDNPFVSSEGHTMTQTHRLQLSSKPDGLTLATKQHLAEISKTGGKKDLAVLLPSADKALFGEAGPLLTGPYEMVLEDPQLKTSYKRLVLMFVVRGNVQFRLKAPEIKCSAADFVEIVAELDSRVVSTQDFQHAKADPIPTIRKLVTAICPDASEQLTMYGFRNYKPVLAEKTTEQLQVICRTQRSHRATLLQGSGNHGLLLRDFIEKPSSCPDTTILPKFWQASAQELHSMLISTQEIPGAAGAAMTRRGIALRIWTASIKEAREALLHNDPRLTEQNRHVIPVTQFESSGWPSSIEAAEVIKAVAVAAGSPPVPTRAYRTAGVHCWSLAFGKDPTKLKFTIDVAGTLHEILLVQSTNRYNPRVSNKQLAGKQKKQKPWQPKEENIPDQVQVISKPSKEEQTRLDKLEAKVGELESRQDKFEKKFDHRLDGVDAALQQLLQRCSSPRRREPTGDTPPPKFPKNSWEAGETPQPRVWILDFLCLWIFCALVDVVVSTCGVCSHHTPPSWTSQKVICIVEIELLWLLLPHLQKRLSLTLVALQALPWFFSHLPLFLDFVPLTSHTLWILWTFCLSGGFGFCGLVTSCVCAMCVCGGRSFQICSQTSAFCCNTTGTSGKRKKCAPVEVCAKHDFLVQSNRMSRILSIHVNVYRCLLKDFDSTLGFPGEGPQQNETNKMVFLSANIGSINTNNTWKAITADVYCLQETRIGKNNEKQTAFQIKGFGKQLFRGKLLPGLLQKNGKHRVAHGGTAIVAPKETTTAFDPSWDTTKIYTKYFEANRCNACWVQVTRKIRVLVFTIYAHTGATSDQHILEQNDTMFAELLEMCSQFGEIPIIFAGDLQHEPLQYPSLSNAIRFGHWNDPLMQISEDGEVFRPLTYSLDGCFSGLGDHNSSIDAMIMNSVALAALESIEVVEIDGIQHRPLRATFGWHRITQKGFVHIKTAPLVCCDVPKPKRKHEDCEMSQRAYTRWQQNYHHKFDTQKSEEAWSTTNDFCVHTLLSEGATLGKGPQERGKLPQFQEKTVCPGQLPDGMVKTNNLHQLYRGLHLMLELSHRVRRVATKPADWHNTRILCRKAWKFTVDHPELQSWPRFETPALDTIDFNIRRLKDDIAASEVKLKQQRIQTWRIRVKESCEGSKSYIFHHLKNKVIDDPPNLITDQKGNTIFQPEAAISEINEQWDQVFAANILRSDPREILRIIWPYIQHEHHQIDAPSLEAEDLFETIQRRKQLAAPGLDGWRTAELQKLPIAVYRPIASYFLALEENAESLAETLVRAKQIILNKNGLADPLQKRLITVLPALALAYTGTRFRQLQTWQTLALPRTIFGAVKGRKMPTIANTIRLDIDNANENNEAVVGLKLDKSKCFDRINPDYAAALFISFGLPSSIVAMFLKLYRGLKRHMFYKSWSSPRPTTASNGVAQGCSMSLLAVNIYAKVWSCMLQKLPGISHAAFIDDSYIWTKVINLQILHQALQVTELWDKLSGQQFNQEKSKLFASTNEARKQAKQMFPTVKACLEIDVLGTMIYTSDRLAYNFPQEKVAKIILDAKNIAYLPLPVEAKASLAGAKIIPQCSFAAGISKITKKDLGRIQAAIAQIIWHGKPSWRAKWLVLALIGSPHRIEPTVARAFCTILDFLHFFSQHPELHANIVRQIKIVDTGKHSLISGVRDAFQLFDFWLTTEGRLAYKDCSSIPLQEVDFRDMKEVLVHLSRNYCYQKASDLHRKDFRKPEGILDFDLTMHAIRSKTFPQNEGITLENYLLNHMVGCSATRDRLAAAKFIEDPTCRFCNQEKESIPHMMTQCKQTEEVFGNQPCHELGANFNTLGIVEHPFPIAKHRLMINSSLPEMPQEIDQNRCQNVWTDGSVYWNKNFWLQSGGFAVVGEDEEVICAGSLTHWSMCSYTTELWAIVQAIATATTCIKIFSDCKAIVEQFNNHTGSEGIPSDCRHPAWWNFIFTACRKFQNGPRSFVEMHWIPAHRYENIPIQLVTVEMAKAAGTEIVHIQGNRKADLVAKEQALKNTAIHPQDEKWLVSSIYKTQLRMAEIGKTLGQDVTMMKKNAQAEQSRPADPQPENRGSLQRSFPTWLWGLSAQDCRVCDAIEGGNCPAKWPLVQSEWEQVKSFLAGCRWFIQSGKNTAFVELAFLFLSRGFHFSDMDNQVTSFRTVLDKLRKAMCCLHRGDDTFFPQEWQRCKNKSDGKALPAGLLSGVMVYMTDEELEKFARLLKSGCAKTLKSWTFAIGDLHEFLCWPPGLSCLGRLVLGLLSVSLSCWIRLIATARCLTRRVRAGW